MKKRLFLLFTALCLCLTLLPTSAMAAGETYLAWNGSKLEEKTQSDPITELNPDSTAWTEGWYIARGEVTISERVTVSGDVHLILANGCKLTVTQGITVEDDDHDSTNGSPNSLTIYAQSTGTARGSLKTGNNSKVPVGAAGIGGMSTKSGGTITINGGYIDVYGSKGDVGTAYGGAGIGGGFYGSGGTITINGGYVYAHAYKDGTAQFSAAAIGGGAMPNPNDRYPGGAGNITVNGGNIRTSSDVRSIGAAYTCVNEGTVAINGGIITGDVQITGSSSNWKNCIVGNTVYGTFVLDDTYPDYNSATPLTIREGASLTLKKDFEVSSNGSTYLTNNGTLVIEEGVKLTAKSNCVVTNNGALTNKGTFEFNSYGNVINSGTITNKGTMSLKYRGITNSSGAKIDNSGTISIVGVSSSNYKLTNDGTLTNSGTITTSDNYTIDNSGSITNTDAEDCSFTIGTGCKLNNNAGATLTNSGALINNGSLVNNGTLTNNGVLYSSGQGFFNHDGAALVNSSGATLTVDDELRNLGTLTNAGSLNITDNGKLSIQSGGTMENTGTLTLADSQKLSSRPNGITGEGSYLISAPLGSNIVRPDDLVYNGQPVTADKFSLPTTITIGGKDFTLPAEEWEFSTFGDDDSTYDAVTDAGEYYVAFKNKADPEKMIQATFSIKPLDISKDGVDFKYTLGDPPAYDSEVKTAPVSNITANGLTVTYEVVNSSDEATNVGDHTLTIEGTGNFKGKREIPWSIVKGENPMTVPGTVCVTYGETDKTIPVTNAAGEVSYEDVGSGASIGVVTVDADGKLTINKAGKAYFKVTAAGDSNYNPITKNVVIDVDKAKNPMNVLGLGPNSNISYTYGDTDKAISVADAVGAVSYAVTSGTDVVSVDAGGNLTFHKGGMATVKVTAVGDENYKSGEKSVSIGVNKAYVTVTALDKKAYVNNTAPDLSNPVLGKDYTLSGLLGNDTLEDTVSISLAYDDTLDMTAVGKYPIIPTVTGRDSRYDFETPVNGTLTLTRRVSTYSVKLPTTPENGTVTFTPQNASKGTTVTITVTPDAGYTLETLSATDKNGEKIPLTDNGDGTYSFKMPASKVTVEATFMDDNTMLNFFVDVSAKDYYYNAVLWAVRNGVTGGIGNNQFAPDASCTRAQLVTFLWKAAGQPEAKGESGFADVSADAYYAKAVAWAFENGIVSGYGEGLFGSDDTITREQMAVILYRFAQHTGTDTSLGGMQLREFNDYQSISDYAVAAVQWAVNAGVMAGSEGSLMPGQPCTRAQIVTMLYSLLGK